MLQTVRKWLYELITSSGIVLYVYPKVSWLTLFLWKFTMKSNHIVTDEGGATMETFKLDGKIVPFTLSGGGASFRDMTIRRDDVLLCGYPKTGCHWVHEILHMLVTGKAEMTKQGKIEGGMLDVNPAIYIDSLPSPRVLNSHLPYKYLPAQVKARKTKIVFTVRSPKDVVVSLYNHIQVLNYAYNYHGKFEHFFKLFVSGEVADGCYLDFILDWDKVMQTQKDNPILLVEYEKLKKDPLGKVKEIARFLDIDITDDFAKNIVKVTDFTNMKTKRTGNKLFRKGQSGDWRNWLTEEQSAEIDQIWKDRMSECFYQPDLS